jgi:hypothetical protein
MMQEFKPIKDYPHHLINKNGIVYNSKTGNYIKPNLGRRGYFTISLCINGVCKTKTLHRIIANCFIPNQDNKPEVNHKNGIKTDNRIDNLEWVTHKENLAYAYELNLINNTGENNKISILKDIQVLEIRDKYNKGVKTSVLSELYNVSKSTINYVTARRNWKHI